MIEPSEKLVSKLLESKPTDQQTAPYLAKELTRLWRLRQRISSLRAERRSVLAEANKKSAIIDEAIAACQKQCKHEETTHHAGYDVKYDECVICGVMT